MEKGNLKDHLLSAGQTPGGEENFLEQSALENYRIREIFV